MSASDQVALAVTVPVAGVQDHRGVRAASGSWRAGPRRWSARCGPSPRGCPAGPTPTTSAWELPGHLAGRDLVQARRPAEPAERRTEGGPGLAGPDAEAAGRPVADDQVADAVAADVAARAARRRCTTSPPSASGGARAIRRPPTLGKTYMTPLFDADHVGPPVTGHVTGHGDRGVRRPAHAEQPRRRELACAEAAHEVQAAVLPAAHQHVVAAVAVEVTRGRRPGWPDGRSCVGAIPTLDTWPAPSPR